MAISKTDGIQLHAEIDNELSKGDSLGAYRGTFFLHVPSSAALLVPLDRSISFSQLEGFEILPEGVPVTPTIELLTQSNTNVQTNVSPTGTQLLSVMWKSNHSTGMPVLLYTPVQNNPLPTTKWYEKIGSNWTLITGMSYSSVASSTFFTSGAPNWFNIEVNSSIAVPLSTATTRTFRAVGYTYTSDGTDTKATNTKTLGNDFSITTTVGDAPTGSITATSNEDSTVTVIHYDSGSPSHLPNVALKFYYYGGFPGLLHNLHGYLPTTLDVWSYTIYRSIDGGADVDVTNEFLAGTTAGTNHQYLSKTQNYTTAGNYTYRLDLTLSRNYTNPAGTAVTLTLAVQESQVVNVTVENIDDIVYPDPPVLISATINEDTVDEGGGMFTLTIATQDAIGQRLTISADEPGVVPQIWQDFLIENNSHSLSFGGAAGTGPGASIIKTSNKSDDRTLTVTVAPRSGGDWLANTTAKSDTITVNNTGFPELLGGGGVNTTVLDEGESFTFTLRGTNFDTTNYTWDTTFPSAAVTATSGSFNANYSGNFYTGNYDGSFTVPTVSRSDHYEDVTGGKITVYDNNGTLFTSTPNAFPLQIKNTHAEPVTLPVATANPSHNVFRDVGIYGTPWSGSQDCTVTLGTDGTYTTSITPQSGELTRNYATPQPLEGDWIPRITGVGQVSSFVSREDVYSTNYEGDPFDVAGIFPGGTITATASFSGATATLSVQGTSLVSSIATAFVAFTWEFYNTASQAIIAGGTISCNISVSALPVSYVYPDPWASAKLACTAANGQWNATTNNCDMGFNDPYADAKLNCEIAGGTWIVDSPTIQYCDMANDEDNFLPLGQLIIEYCDENVKMGRYANGYGGFYQAVIEFDSVSCGYEATPSSTGTAPTTGSTDPNIEIFVEADLQAQIQAQLNLSGALDLSNLLASLNLNLGI